MSDAAGARGDRGPRRRWRTRVSIVLAIALAAFVTGELAVRAMVGAPLAERLPLLAVRANPLRGFEMVEGLHYTYRHPVHVNALGLRGPELGPADEGELRVLALGDSLVYGQGVADDETLPAFLEAALRRSDPRGRRWSVVNGGLRGYDTRQELALLAELEDAIRPDVVVLFWFWNDCLERPIAQSFANLERDGPVVFDTGDRLEDGQLWRWRLRQLVRKSALVMLLHDRLRSLLGSTLEPEVLERGLEHLRSYLERFRALGRKHGFRPVVAVVPDPNRLLGPAFTDALEGRVAELARELELPLIELLEPLRALAAREGRPPVLPYDGHYLPRANRAMAEAAARELLLLVAAQD